MSMEKIGVNNLADQQKEELHNVQEQIKKLDSSHEKTASDTQKSEQLHLRSDELKDALRQ